MRNATEKASITGPLPNSAAIPMSRIKPRIRLSSVSKLTTRRPENRVADERGSSAAGCDGRPSDIAVLERRAVGVRRGDRL